MSRRRAARGRRLAPMLRGSIALATLAVLVVGLPLALYRLGGDPLPSHVPSWHSISSGLLHRDNGTVFLGVVRDLSWIAWALFTAAVLAEAQATLRGRRAPKLRVFGLQSAASWLVAVSALAFTGQPGAVLASTHAPVPVVSPAARPAAMAFRTTTTLPQDQSAGPNAADPQASQVMSMGFSQMVTVRSGDCLWTIAQHYLGDGDLFPEIVKLNIGHDMGDGQRFTDPSVVWPGWVLQLPAQPTLSPRRRVVNHAARPGRPLRESRCQSRRPRLVATRASATRIRWPAGRPPIRPPRPRPRRRRAPSRPGRAATASPRRLRRRLPVRMCRRPGPGRARRMPPRLRARPCAPPTSPR